VDLVDISTQVFWLDAMTMMQSELGKVSFMKIVENYLILPPTKFQSIEITKSRDMSKILSTTSGGRGG
jgi:hypothetical protein